MNRISLVWLNLILLVLVAAPIAWLWLVAGYLPTRRARRAARFRRAQLRAEEREAVRQLDGLPPHPRCLCDKCRAWRLVEGNSERLRLRGLR